MKNKKIRYFILFLLCIVSIVTGSLYAYWAGTINNPSAVNKDSAVVTIGQGKDVTTTLVVSEPGVETKKLVPAGKTNFSAGGSAQNVESVEKTITVKWVDSENVVTSADNVVGNLSVVATTEIQGASNSNWGLAKVVVNPSFTSIKLNDSGAVTVTIKVTLDEPASKAVYDDIINKPILVHLKFSVSQ